MSRFRSDDELIVAPSAACQAARGALAGGGQLPNFLGVLAGSPAALRAYARFRSELRHGRLGLAITRADRARAEHHGAQQNVATHSRAQLVPPA